MPLSSKPGRDGGDAHRAGHEGGAGQQPRAGPPGPPAPEPDPGGHADRGQREPGQQLGDRPAVVAPARQQRQQVVADVPDADEQDHRQVEAAPVAGRDHLTQGSTGGRIIDPVRATGPAQQHLRAAAGPDETVASPCTARIRPTSDSRTPRREAGTAAGSNPGPSSATRTVTAPSGSTAALSCTWAGAACRAALVSASVVAPARAAPTAAGTGTAGIGAFDRDRPAGDDRPQPAGQVGAGRRLGHVQPLDHRQVAAGLGRQAGRTGVDPAGDHGEGGRHAVVQQPVVLALLGRRAASTAACRSVDSCWRTAASAAAAARRSTIISTVTSAPWTSSSTAPPGGSAWRPASARRRTRPGPRY